MDCRDGARCMNDTHERCWMRWKTGRHDGSVPDSLRARTVASARLARHGVGGADDELRFHGRGRLSANKNNDPVPFSPDAALDLTPEADQILRAVRRITQSITIQSKQLYRQSGLTVPQLLCLRAISAARSVDVTAAEISRQVRLSPATVTGIIDRLERYGLVQRKRFAHDRRKVGLRLTAEGRERLATMPRPLQERFVRGLNELTEADRKSLLRALQQVVDMLEATQLDVAPILTSGDVKKSTPEL